MRLSLIMCGMVLAVLPASGEAAKPTRLQTVNLTGMEEFMSTEGGEARLYRTNDPRHGVCRIEAVHFGEMGKAIYVFDFGSKLRAAERREYRYSVPIYESTNPKAILTERMTLAGREGRTVLLEDFRKYKALFDVRNLAACSGK